MFFQLQVVAHTGDVAVEADVFDNSLDSFGIGIDVVRVRNLPEAFPCLKFGDCGQGVGLIFGLDVVEGYIGKFVESLFIVIVVSLFIGLGDDHEIADITFVVFLDIELAGSGFDEFHDIGVLVHPKLDGFGHKGLFHGHNVQHLDLPIHRTVAALLVHRQVGDFGIQVFAGDDTSVPFGKDVSVIEPVLVFKFCGSGFIRETVCHSHSYNNGDC
ncbi:MAG: hypothetical protein BWX83_00132 [Candidatus Cloacimonetes bacterium ADurb.Bin117]|nr:MAG: hypothetical protein BWX83_00132 [Candidatus Cloacimonetes bacterium ADurb.Bin117]